MLARTCPLVAVLLTLHGLAVADESQSRAADEVAIREVTQAFITTRDDNDEAGLRALLTAAVDQGLTSGSIRSGRDAVVSGALDMTRGTGGTRSIKLDTIRFLGDDVAIANGRYNSLGRSDGADLRMQTTMVFWRVDGNWLIDAIRNVRLADGT